MHGPRIIVNSVNAHLSVKRHRITRVRRKIIIITHNGGEGISWLTVAQISSGLIEDGLAKRVVSAVSGERRLDYLRRTRFPFEYPWINYRPSLSDRFVSTGGEKGRLFVRIYKLFVRASALVRVSFAFSFKIYFDVFYT